MSVSHQSSGLVHERGVSVQFQTYCQRVDTLAESLLLDSLVESLVILFREPHLRLSPPANPLSGTTIALSAVHQGKGQRYLTAVEKGVFVMLVLSRKPGEQIVLPDSDVTVTVLGISGKRVRLGIAAPPDISIARHEIRDRVCERKIAPPNTNETAVGGTAQVPPPPELDAMLAHSITRRSGGRIGSLHVETVEGRVVIHGRARSYHALQLAQVAVTDALLQVSSSQRPEGVEFDIEVFAP